MHSFLSSLLTMSLGGSALALAAFALRFVFKKLKAPAWLNVLLWAAVAVRLLIPSLPKTTVSVMPQPEAVSEVVEAMVPAAVQAPAPAQENYSTVSFSADDPRTPTFPEGATGVQEPEEEKRFTPSAEFWFAVWGVGAAAVLGWGVLGWLRLEQRVRVSVKGERNVYFCDDIQSPFLLGLFAPRIYVPSFLEGEALNNVLAHEQAHLKRRDYLIKPFAFLLLAVYWFNPLFWLAYALLCRDIEYACDEKVFKDMDREAIASYSETLLTFHAPGRMLSACPVAFGEVGVKRRIKAALSYKKPAFWIILTAALVLGFVCVFLLTDRTTDVTRIFPAESEEIRAAIHEAALSEVQGKGWAEGAVEGHVMLGSEEKDGVTEVYAYCAATELGFINGVLTSDGTGFSGPCTFLLQPQDNGGYVCVDIIWPKDGEDRYAASIREMMPPSLWRKAQRNLTAITNAINAQETEDAKAYLQSLDREAPIELRLWKMDLKTLTDLGVHLLAAERSEKERPTALEQCPSFVGTTEILENGVLRWVYETALNAEKQTIVYSKYDYASGEVFARAVFDAQTGELLDQLVYEDLPTAYPQLTDAGALNGNDLVYGSKVECDLNGNGVPDTLYLIYGQGIRLLAVESGAPLAESDFVTNGDEYELSYDENEADPVRLTAHYFSDTGIIRLNAPVRLNNGRIETEPAADGFPRYVDPMTYNTTSITTQFIPEAVALSENESIRIYDADNTRVLAGVLWHDPSLEQDFGTLKTMYELTLDGKKVISYANSSETGMFDARLSDNGYYALGLEKTECSLIRFIKGNEPDIIYRASRDPKQEAGLSVLKNGNIAVVTVSQKHVLTCAVLSPAGQTLSENKTELAWDGRITQLRMIPLTDGGVCYSADILYDTALNDTGGTESVVTGIVSTAGEFTTVDGAYGQCRGMCGEYLLFSAYENNQADGQVISLYKDGKMESQIERKPPENNVLIGFTQFGRELFAACYGEGEVLLEAANGELYVQRFSPNAFTQYGGIASFGGTDAYAGVVFSESLGVYPYRTVLSVTVKNLIESEYPDFEVLAVVSDTQATGPSQVRYAAIARNKEDQTSSTLFVLNDYGVLTHVVLAAGCDGQYLEQYGLHLEQDRVSFSLSLNGDGSEREIHDFTVTCSLKDGGNIEFKNEENKHAS